MRHGSRTVLRSHVPTPHPSAPCSCRFINRFPPNASALLSCLLQDMVAGANGENEPEAWRRLPDTAWLQRNFADRHEAAWRAHTDRLRYTDTHAQHRPTSDFRCFGRPD